MELRSNPGTGPIASVRERRGQLDAHGNAVQRMFDRISPTYDLVNRVLSAGLDRAWRKRAIDWLEPRPGGPILDLCAGTLDLAARLERRYPFERIVAADFSADMLDRGASKAPSTARVVADAMDLPFREGEFSAVVCGFGVRNVGDVSQAVAEVKRVLAVDGVFVTLEFFRPVSSATEAFHRLYARALLPRVGGLLSGDGGAYRYLADSMGAFLSRAEYENLLAQHGFVVERSADLQWGVASVIRARLSEARGGSHRDASPRVA
jgi:ubiquinone/menaquinone biosynthesis methyltransferase